MSKPEEKKRARRRRILLYAHAVPPVDLQRKYDCVCPTSGNPADDLETLGIKARACKFAIWGSTANMAQTVLAAIALGETIWYVPESLEESAKRLVQGKAVVLVHADLTRWVKTK
jgi:hypothetical protein